MSKLAISFASASEAGPKAINEDAVAAHAPDQMTIEQKGIVAVLSDGASCSDQAQMASRTAVSNFIADYLATPDSWSVKMAASKVLSALNSWLYHQGRQASHASDSLVATFCGIVFKSTSAHLFHIGDSRIYRLRDQQLTCLTQDHSRSVYGGKTMLTRALGIDTHLEVDYQTSNLDVGDQFLISSDGLHGFVREEQIQRVLTSGKTLEEKATLLINTAKINGTDDNLSCLLCQVDSVAKPDLNELYRLLKELAIPPVLEPGMKIDDYRVLEVLHSSTRSHLYLVEDEQAAGERYVLKAPSAYFSDEPQYLEGFLHEEWVGLRLDHKHVMKILPRRSGSKFLYHLSEHIEGISLRQWALDHPKPELADVRKIVQQIASGLRAFQRLDMVHRDLKPENVLLCQDGTGKIVDFGTVRAVGHDESRVVTAEQYPVGSTHYIAPEYLFGQLGDFRSDMFSLSVMTYEMLAGERPYPDMDLQHKQPKDISPWHYRSITRLRPDLPTWLDLALRKGCEPKPERRQHAYSEWLEDISRPNSSLVSKHEQAPLAESNPTLFWKIIALILLGLNLVQIYLLLT